MSKLHMLRGLLLAGIVFAASACNLLTGAADLDVEQNGAGGSDGAGAAAGTGASGPGVTAGPGATGGPSSTGSGVSCGDGVCGPGEDCLACPGDCGACAESCGDGTCQASESCVNCPTDCGSCPPACGNGSCEAGETCSSCASDCGACGPSCGDGTCDPNETCSSCASDCGACAMCGGAGDATTTLDAEEQAFLGLINQYRAQNGLGALAACTSLSRAAQGHSEDMRDNNYFSHTGLNNSSPWDRACDACYQLGCGPQTAMAENIAAGNSGAQGTFDQWKNSPGHNANMLGANFTRLGIGRATGGGQYGVYWTNVFGGASEASCN